MLGAEAWGWRGSARVYTAGVAAVKLPAQATGRCGLKVPTQERCGLKVRPIRRQGPEVVSRYAAEIG